ncbi:DUF4381 domain-containing protein [Enterovibrio calviensis]|uniref:DUF4381 domain-containing protein n=1 Tax=Enterovibrio calviensis TaxID=91359 RepID=UPI0037369FDF
MTNTASTTLPLADIQLQIAPGIWPLAWGWWALIAALLAGTLLAIFLLRQRTQRLQARNEALNQLTQADSLAAINALLKRAALSYFDRDLVAGLTGSAWLAFLDSQLPAIKQGFVAQDELWQKGIFANVALSDAELDTCKALAETWLKQALPPSSKPINSNATKEANHV